MLQYLLQTLAQMLHLSQRFPIMKLGIARLMPCGSLALIRVMFLMAETAWECTMQKKVPLSVLPKLFMTGRDLQLPRQSQMTFTGMRSFVVQIGSILLVLHQPQGGTYLKFVWRHVKLLATGGVNSDNVGSFLKLGMAGVGVGGNLCSKVLVSEGRFDEITGAAMKYIAAVRGDK